MQFFVTGEFVEENIAGKPMEEAFAWIGMVVHPSLEALDKMVQDRQVTGGVAAGARVLHMIIDASSGEEVGKMLRSLPLWGAARWTVTPLQSFRSAVEQDRASFERARAMAAGPR